MKRRGGGGTFCNSEQKKLHWIENKKHAVPELAPRLEQDALAEEGGGRRR